jgi:hypothetical protein
MSKIPLAGALLLALLPAAPVLANLNVHPMRVHAEAGRPRPCACIRSRRNRSTCRPR